ncbi:MAG TPA: basic amino acid ABC transporter substrate-binding protein [Rectinemataceae bacterium]|nr:basic amino acid ABC transporter substrate-binding protein [Rectinemataceae bacterium]
MKRVPAIRSILLLAALFVSFSFVSCGNSGGQKVLRVGTNAEYPPFEYKSADGKEFLGIDMDIAREIAAKLGYKLEIDDVQFDSLIPSLMAGKFDMAMAAITITPDRQKQVDFSVPYYTSNQAILVKSDSTLQISSLDDLAKLKVGCQNGTTGQIYMDDNLVKPGKMKADSLIKFPTNIEAIAALNNGTIDALIIDDPVAAGYQKMQPVKKAFVITTDENYGIAFPKGSKLEDKVNGILKNLMASDKFNEILHKQDSVNLK